ncbi:Nucleoside-specific channel-forming protein, Tsx [Ferrimonas sediminum]|uniref:Nucleoside-specific channel-forming protein, Tsx n=1 Tax=Ferrimonas sediminum TaxID=718193 RepID=A0A1G8JJL9_9GAMM|nr:outer membrane protein OmpK [Ferrimonas sediminum]SDI31499.1 Nucleoside-specific channel-forming protein, Tsx [Ferrimonas sediminum]
MKNKTTLSMIVLSGLLSTPASHAQVFNQVNSVKVGYELLLDAEDNNPNLYDQPYLSFQHFTLADWGSIAGWLRLENPTDSAENQQGKDAGATTKTWLKLDFNLGKSPFNLWAQSYTMGNKTCTEEDFYFGASYDLAYGKLKGTVGLGGHYGWGTFNPTGKSYNGMNGGAAHLLLVYPLANRLSGKIYYETQFGRSEEMKQTLIYNSYGHMLVVGANYYFAEKLWAGASYRHRKSWGGAKNDGGNLFFDLGYRF